MKRYFGAALLGAGLIAWFCGGCSVSTGRTMYDIAVKAAKADSALPKDAAPAARGSCKFHIGKSAATVEIPCSPRGDTYVVWLKRICTHWELDRSRYMPAGK